MIIAHKADPTDMAGPGTDIPAMFLFIVAIFILFGRSVAKFSVSKLRLLSFAIHFIALAGIVAVMVLPSNSW